MSDPLKDLIDKGKGDLVRLSMEVAMGALDHAIRTGDLTSVYRVATTHPELSEAQRMALRQALVKGGWQAKDLREEEAARELREGVQQAAAIAGKVALGVLLGAL